MKNILEVYSKRTGYPRYLYVAILGNPEQVDDFKSSIEDLTDLIKTGQEAFKQFTYYRPHQGSFFINDLVKQARTLVELNLDRLGTSKEKCYLGEEIMFPLLNIVKGDHHTDALIADMMGQGSHDGRILEYSVFSEEDGIFKYFEHHGRAFNYHRNEPTPWGLGNTRAGKFRYHQRKCLAVELAGFK